LTLGSPGESFILRYDVSGHLAWDRPIATEVQQAHPASIASGAGGTWVGGTSHVPIMDIPNAHPDDNYFVRQFGWDGDSTFTGPLVTARIVGDCSSFVTIEPARPDPDSYASDGAYIARWSAVGQARWRWEQTGTSGAAFSYSDVAIAGDRAYVIRDAVYQSTSTHAHELGAIDGIPARTDCDSTSRSRRT